MVDSAPLNCGSCRTPNHSGRRFCSECGAALHAGCPECGTPNETGEKFCGGCGTAVAPATRPQIDEAQLAALVAVQAVLDEIGLDLERVEPDKVAVVSASVTALGAATRLSHRMRYRELAALVPAEVESVRKALARSRDELAPLTEDSGPGILNNVIAGRVANTFNLTGPSFNVDADLASAGLAHWVATNLLGPSCRLVLLIDVHERWNSDKNRVERDSVEVKLLATEEATWEFGLPRLRLLAEVEHVA